MKEETLWIARDKDNGVRIFSNKPEHNGLFFIGDDMDFGYIIGGGTQFPEVTFENSPMEVELKLKKV